MDKEWAVTQLKFSLQALSLKAEDQIASFPDFVVVTDELLLEFDNWYNIAVGNYPEFFSKEQLDQLLAVYEYLDCWETEDPNQSIKDELIRSHYWKKLRVMSHDALLKFGWPSEKPPINRVTYIKG